MARKRGAHEGEAFLRCLICDVKERITETTMFDGGCPSCGAGPRTTESAKGVPMISWSSVNDPESWTLSQDCGHMLPWEQKMRALKALGRVSIELSDPRGFCCSGNMEVGGDGFLESVAGLGMTPEAAVEEVWRKCVTELPTNMHLRTADGRRVRWNGFMWVDVPFREGRS